MSEHPSIVAREAKGVQQSLKELLKTREPYDKEVDFQRKNLRKKYLRLLLVYPGAKEAKDVENHLWMQTSYLFISAYKQRITALDRAIQNNQKQPQQHQPGQGHPHGRQNPHHGVVEHRKLVQRFKQFLAEEEKFWTQLVLRLLRLFDLREARPAVIALGLLNEADEAIGAPSANGDLVDTPEGANSRNHFQFPPEDTSTNIIPSTPEEREVRLGTLSKALICLGDIARYREQYNEANGRPRAGHEDLVPPRRGRGRRGGAPDVFVRPRNYEKAQQCYEQARQLVPYEGNPSHQLAILASYKNDSFSSIIHYYRSLCVRQPYETATENLGTVLSKALDKWRQRLKKERDPTTVDPTTSALPIHIRVDLFKDQIVTLHALWRVGLEKGVDKMKSILPKHNEKVSRSFFALVSQRHLPDSMILNTILLSQGAVWKHRMIRDTSSSRSRQSEPPIVPEGTDVEIEWAIMDHLLDLHFSLLEVGKDELKDPPQTDVADDLAQRISATFRRTLPALRVASKWLRANYNYLSRDKEFQDFEIAEKRRGVDVLKGDSTKISGYSTKTIRFWKAYAAFMLVLSQAFPADKLPAFNGPLEEDLELKGFSPLHGFMMDARKADTKSTAEEVHPNVEQLKRISDLIADAKSLAQVEYSPLQLINGHYVFRLDSVEEIRPPTHPERLQSVALPVIPAPQQNLMANIRDSQKKREQDVDAMTELTSRTDDDPVRDAFQFLNAPEDSADDDEFEEDEVVYMRSSVSPTLSPKAFATPVTPVKPLISPKKESPSSPVVHPIAKPPVFALPASTAPIPTTTAQDLLNDVLGNTLRRTSITQPSTSTAPQPKFLFGSELSHRPSQSIWSAAQDEQPLMYTSTGTTSGGIHASSPSTSVSTMAARPPHANSTYSTAPGLAGSADFQSATTASGGPFYQSSPSFQPAQHHDHFSQHSQHSIWSSSIDSSQDSQSIGVLPSAPFAHPPQIGLGLGQPPLGLSPYNHSRIPSGPSAQVYASPSLAQLQLHSDPYLYPSPTLQQPPVHRTEPFQHPSTGFVGSSLLNGPLPTIGEAAFRSSDFRGSLIGSIGPGQPYYTSPGPGHHSRQVSANEGRVAGPQSYFNQPNPLVWGNTG